MNAREQARALMLIQEVEEQRERRLARTAGRSPAQRQAWQRRRAGSTGESKPSLGGGARSTKIWLRTLAKAKELARAEGIALTELLDRAITLYAERPVSQIDQTEQI